MATDGLGLKLRNGRWHVYGTFRGVRVRESAGTVERDRALARKAEIELRIINGTYVPAGARKDGSSVGAQALTFDEVAVRYLKSPGTGSGESTVLYVRRLARYFKGVDVLKIGASEAEAYVEDVLPTAAKSTVQRELTQLQAILNYGRELLRVIPLKIRKPRPDETEFRVVEDDEFQAMWDLMTVHERWVFGFMRFTGARPSQAVLLAHRRVTMGKDGVTPVRAALHMQKGRGKGLSYYKVPLNLKAAGLVREAQEWTQAAGLKNISVFLRENGGVWDRGYLYERLSKLSKVAKLAEPVAPYDLRHTFATMLARKGVYPQVLQKLMGHSSITMTMRYIHVDDDAIESATRLFDQDHMGPTRHLKTSTGGGLTTMILPEGNDAGDTFVANNVGVSLGQ